MNLEFSFNGLVEDLEVALSNNFDSKEKVNSIGQVGADLLLLRELRNKLQADPQILSNNGICFIQICLNLTLFISCSTWG